MRDTLPKRTLLVYFVSEKRDNANSTNEIYVAARHPGATAWEPAVLAAGINSSTLHDHLPFVARTGSNVTLVWVRNDVRAATLARADLERVLRYVARRIHLVGADRRDP